MPPELVKRGSELLKKHGKLVEQLLTDPQKSAFNQLRSSGRISRVRLAQTDTGQIGVSYDVYESVRNTRARFRTNDALLEIQNFNDALAVLNFDDDTVKSFAARWLRERRDTAYEHSAVLRDTLRPLMSKDALPERQAFIAVFCMVADKRDSDLLRHFIEHPGDDPDDILPALSVLIRENPVVVDQHLRSRLDDLWWHDESLSMFEKMGRDAHATLALMSDILHPNWREPIRELLRGSGHEAPDSLVTEHRIEWAVEQFCGSDRERQQSALTWLAGAKPNDSHRDTRVTCLLRSMLDSTQGDERILLATAFSRWASEEDKPVLVKLLEEFEKDRESAGLAVDALLRLDPIFVASLLAPPDGDDRFRTGVSNPYLSIVAGRVSQITDRAEATLLLLFEIPEERLRLAVCRALAREGNGRAIQILSDSLKGDSLTDQLKSEITRTISQIRRRQ